MFRIMVRSGKPKKDSGKLTILTLVERIPPADPPTIEVAVNVLVSISIDMAICLLVCIYPYQHPAGFFCRKDDLLGLYKGFL